MHTCKNQVITPKAGTVRRHSVTMHGFYKFVRSHGLMESLVTILPIDKENRTRAVT